MYRNTATLNRPCVSCEPCHECGQPANEFVPRLHPKWALAGLPFCSWFCREFTMLVGCDEPK